LYPASYAGGVEEFWVNIDYTGGGGYPIYIFSDFNDFLANADATTVDQFFNGVYYGHDAAGNIVGYIPTVMVLGTQPSTPPSTVTTPPPVIPPPSFGGGGGSTGDGGSGGVGIQVPLTSSGCDCAGIQNGKAYVDNCGNCVGGTTGKLPCADCAGVVGGSAYKDACGNCVGGNTGKQPCAPPETPCDSKAPANGKMLEFLFSPANVLSSNGTVTVTADAWLQFNAAGNSVEIGMAFGFDKGSNSWFLQPQDSARTKWTASGGPTWVGVGTNCATAMTAHTHTTADYSTPSAQDVLTCVQRVNSITYTYSNYCGGQGYYYGDMVTAGLAGGGMAEYFLYVADPAKAQAFYLADINGSYVGADNGFIKETTIGGFYNNAWTYYNSNKASLGMSDNDVRDAALAYALQQANTGLTLLKFNPATGKFEPIAVSKVGNSYKKLGCL